MFQMSNLQSLFRKNLIHHHFIQYPRFMKFSSLFLTVILFSTVAFSQTKDKDEGKPIDSLVVDMERNNGIINTYLSDEKLFFEINDSILETDFLMVTRLAKLPSRYSPYVNAGSKTSEQLIHFEKNGKKILITQQSYVNLAQEEDPIKISVEQNNKPPIIAAFEIKNKEQDRYLIDVSSYFSNDSPGFNILSNSIKTQYGIGSLDSNRSFFNSIRSFEKNVEVHRTMTYNISKPASGNTSDTFSFEVNHSLILLPQDLMPIRYEDPRVGWFTLTKYNYSSKALKSDDFSIVRRWRLEPSDTEAYNRGELVEPKKQIVYYLDPATPHQWRPYFKQGIEDWNTAFEKAGFKNAIVAKDPPSKEEDPDFSPEDIRYSTVRYVASTTRNAMGPSVSDPRTGEIIESDIIWYHNHLRSYRNRYLLETAAANPKARTLETPESEIGEMMRQVIAHEIGHALGLPHNMKASSAYPVDSLRSGSFTQKYGIATTLMDYARYNYVAQPGDTNIRFVRKLGPYDEYSIEWGYRYFDGETPESERELLNQMVDEKSTNPIYMFGSGGSDPDSQTENIGDDPIKASGYGLKNLKIVAENLETWTTNEGQSYDDLEELHNELLSVYSRYVNHVARIVGGVHQTIVNKGQNRDPYVVVDAEKQLDALHFLNKQLWKTPSWLIEKKLVSKFSSDGLFQRVSNIQQATLRRLLSDYNLNRMLSTQYTVLGNSLSVDAFLDQLISDITNLTSSSNNAFSRSLEKTLVDIIVHAQENEDAGYLPEIKGLFLGHANGLLKSYKSKMRSGNQLLKAHYTYCFHQLNELFD